MIVYLLEDLLHMGIILPFAILWLSERNRANIQRLIIFVFVFLVYQIALQLPILLDIFNFVKSSRWNWDGKLIGALCGILCYFIFKKHLLEHDYLTLQQEKKGFKPALIGAMGIVVLASVVWFIFGESEFDLETLAFQLTLPGIDEEFVYRGILLGLLMSSLNRKVSFIGNPSVLLIAVLFGVIHALQLSKDYEISFNMFYFVQTAFAGYVWGWITVKSRSILLAMLSHNLSNFFGTLVTMIK